MSIKFKVIGFILLQFFIIWLFFSSCEEKTQEEIDSIISKSERLTRLDNLCSEIETPKDFELLRKRLFGNSYTSSLAYYYKTNLKSIEVEPIIFRWLKSNGWVLTESNNKFSKDNQRIVINQGYFARANYVITCNEEFSDSRQ
jgi:hypothetical protein